MTGVLTFPRAPAEAFYEAVGDELTEFAGYRFTKATAAVAAGASAIPVESTFGWPASGTIIHNGQTYSYASKSPTALITVTPGLVTPIRIGDPIVDWSRTFSGLDLARNALFVGTAEGSDLDVLGRNVGLSRYTGLDDTTYRALLRELGWGPKGTIQSIRAALTALVGVGNFEVDEDLIGHPCEVFVTLNMLALGVGNAGKTFVQNKKTVAALASTTVVPLTGDPARGTSDDNVVAVYLAPSTHAARMLVRPSSEPGTPWTYTGVVAEGTTTGVSVSGVPGIFINDASGASVGGQYQRALQVEPDSDIDVSWTMSFSASSSLTSLGLRIEDSNRGYGVAFNGTAVQLYDHVAAAVVGGAHTVGTTVHSYRLTKRGDLKTPANCVIELWIDGVLVETAAGTAFTTTANRTLTFGAFSGAGTMASLWYGLDVSISSRRNHWNVYGYSNTNFSTASPTQINVGGGTNFVAADVGRIIVIRNGAASNGRNNGRWRINTQATTQCTVQGLIHDGVEFLAFNKIRIPERHFDHFLANDCGVKATRTTGSAGAGLKWTAVYGGTDAHAITVALVNAGASKPLAVSVSVAAISVQLATDGSSVITSTAAQVMAAVNAHAQASALVTAATLDGVGASLMVAIASGALAGGIEGKTITFAGTAGGVNDGTFKLATLIDDRTALVGSHSSLPALVPGATGGSWQRNPIFVTENNLDRELLACGTLQVSPSQLTVRTAFYATGLTAEVHYLSQDGGIIFLNEFVHASDEGAGVDPFYLFDNLSFFRDILDELTVAGVHVRVDVEAFP